MSGEPIDPSTCRETTAAAVERVRQWLGTGTDAGAPRMAVALLAGLADAVLETKPSSAGPLQWPAQRDVGRAEDMGQGHLRVVLDADNDVCVEVFDGERCFASVEFCNPGGGGGGRSRRTRLALIRLMSAIEADNAERPELRRPVR